VRLAKPASADLEVPEVDPRAPVRTDWAVKTQALQTIPADAQLGDVADFWAQSRMLRAAGLGFSDAECYALALSIRNLAFKYKAVSARFWGKILGLENDYYVTELELAGMDVTKSTDPLEQTRADYVEPRGVGANKYVYCVCTSVPGEWVQLPNATPAQIKRSREICKMFTGNLDKPILSHPPFPWTERELLRSMIARITHDTMLAPDGYYALEGEEGSETITAKPGFSFGGEAPVTADKWVHARPYLRSNGRCTFPNDVVDEAVPEDERTRINTALEGEREADTNITPGGGVATSPAYLIPVATEIEFETGLNKPAPWLLVKSEEAPDGKFRVLGDPSTYGFPDPKGPKSYAVTLIESLKFPGAYTVAQGDAFCNIYVGYGLMKQRAFLPLQEMAPLPVMEEPADLKELIQEPIEEDIDMEEAVEGEDED